MGSIASRPFGRDLVTDMGSRGAWVVRSVKRPTLNFGSGHDLVAREIETQAGLCTDRVEPAWDSLSPFPSLPHPHPLTNNSALKTRQIGSNPKALQHIQGLSTP